MPSAKASLFLAARPQAPHLAPRIERAPRHLQVDYSKAAFDVRDEAQRATTRQGLISPKNESLFPSFSH
jgi:hypothetical protein